MNTYKGSIRDGRKYVTYNGDLLPMIFLHNWGCPHNWGWYGKLTDLTSYLILEKEFGEEIAKDLHMDFSRNYLALQPEDGFVIGSNYMAYIVEGIQLDKYRNRVRL
jgi:hypothetical protein